jgi:hypothetical protein
VNWLISNFLSEKYEYEIKAYDNYILTTKIFNIPFFQKIKWLIGEKLNLKRAKQSQLQCLPFAEFSN